MKIVIDLKEIIEVAKATDAVGFDKFVEENKIEVEYLQYTVANENDGIYEVYLFEFDTTILYINGNYIHNEDLTIP